MLPGTGQRSYPDGSARRHSFTSSRVGVPKTGASVPCTPSIRHGVTYSADATLARAWVAFLQAIAEAQELHDKGVDGSVLADLLQHARELLEIIRDEIVLANGAVPKPTQDALNELQYRVATLEVLLIPCH